jgi:hypothetical protein
MPIYQAVFVQCDEPGCDCWACVGKETLPSGEERIVHNLPGWDLGTPLGTRIRCTFHVSDAARKAEKEKTP